MKSACIRANTWTLASPKFERRRHLKPINSLILPNIYSLTCPPLVDSRQFGAGHQLPSRPLGRWLVRARGRAAPIGRRGTDCALIGPNLPPAVSERTAAANENQSGFECLGRRTGRPRCVLVIIIISRLVTLVNQISVNISLQRCTARNLTN